MNELIKLFDENLLKINKLKKNNKGDELEKLMKFEKDIEYIKEFTEKYCIQLQKFIDNEAKLNYDDYKRCFENKDNSLNELLIKYNEITSLIINMK